MAHIRDLIIAAVLSSLVTAYFFAERTTRLQAETVFLAVVIIIGVIVVFGAIAAVFIGLIYLWNAAWAANRIYPDEHGNLPIQVGFTGGWTNFNLPQQAEDIMAWAHWVASNYNTSVPRQPAVVPPEPARPYLLPTVVTRDEQAPPLLLEARRIANEEM